MILVTYLFGWVVIALLILLNVNAADVRIYLTAAAVLWPLMVIAYILMLFFMRHDK